jgi:glutaredoxin
MKKTDVKSASGKKLKKSVYKRTQIKIVKTKLKKKKSHVKRVRSVDGNYAIVAPKKNKIGYVKDGTSDKGWVIYSLKGCQYCKDAKNLLQQRKVKFTDVDFESLDEDKKKSILKDIDGAKPGFRTFPRIFSPTTFIGGYSDLTSSLI